MPAGREDGTALVWERPEPVRRPAPNPLSRPAIVRAAIELADAGGLEAVSLRKVAGALGAGPMRLYGYLSTKEELLDLMVDEVYGEMVEDGAGYGPDWRSTLRELAHRLRAAALRHEWFVELFGGRPHLGPHALAHLETRLAALDGAPGFTDIDAVLRAVSAVQAYSFGAIRAEIAERATERATGQDEAGWQAASSAYLRRVLATGRFPTLEKVVVQARHTDPGTGFDAGLDLVLDGIAARLAR